jgi:hypothetical protein
MELVQLTAAIAIGSLMIAAFFIVLSALFSDRISRVRAAATAMPGRSVVVGLVNWIFFAAVVLALVAVAERTHIQLLALPALVIAAVLAVAAIFGLAGVVELVGGRLLTQTAGARRTGLGALVLAWACALPYAGWFALLPYVLALGLGAVILSLIPVRPANG